MTYSGKSTTPKACPVGVWTTVVDSLKTWPAESISDGGTFTAFVTATWFGANPGALVWQVRPRVGIASLQVNTRYSKGLN